MADTRYYKTHVEPYVRAELQRLHGHAFHSKVLTLSTGGTHEFDAVSEDKSIVASIKSLSGKTKGGKNGAARYANCVAQIYFLSLVSAATKMLVLTTPVQHSMFIRYIEGRLVPGVSVELLVLPPDIQAEVDRIRDIASGEVSPL
jgi:hypothetical protein